jgi:hypothetical protein
MFVSGSIHLHYSAGAGSGTRTFSSDTTEVAQINIIGTYTSANFSAGADSQGNVKIFDPVVPKGGSVEPFPQQGVDLPNIAFGAQTMLAYAENTAGTGGTLTVSDEHRASATMATSFITAADGRGGPLVTETLQKRRTASDTSASVTMSAIVSRLEGAKHQWRKIPPAELSIDREADEQSPGNRPSWSPSIRR